VVVHGRDPRGDGVPGNPIPLPTLLSLAR
jgi:hypothetical protein